MLIGLQPNDTHSWHFSLYWQENVVWRVLLGNPRLLRKTSSRCMIAISRFTTFRLPSPDSWRWHSHASTTSQIPASFWVFFFSASVFRTAETFSFFLLQRFFFNPCYTMSQLLWIYIQGNTHTTLIFPLNDVDCPAAQHFRLGHFTPPAPLFFSFFLFQTLTWT